MGSVPSESEILSAARPLVAAGIAVHWLRRREKAPIDNGWSTAPVHTFETLRDSYRSGSNLGIRLGEPSKTAAGYVHLIDMDIRDPAQADDAWTALLALWPEAREAPYVVSGSGGESRHVYFVTDRPFRSLKVARSVGFQSVFDPKKAREVRKHDWEVELFGTGKQAVLPPSIHPDTGNAYEWGVEPEWDLLELGVGLPILPSEEVQSWGAASDDLSTGGGEDDDLFALVRSEPMGLSAAEIDGILAEIPNEDAHHDDFVQVGMALHHEFRGSQIGFERWCEWAKQSAKFDIRTCQIKWKSFGKRVQNPVRMATLIKAAADHRLAVAHAALDDGFAEPDDDLSDLLGGPSTALTVIPAAAPAVDADLAELLGGTPQPIAPGAGGVSRAALVYDPEWRSHFHRNAEGELKSTLHNVRLIVRNDIRLRGIIAKNSFSQDIVLIRSPAKAKLQKESPKPVVQLDSAIWKVRDPINGNLWTDSHDAAVRALIEAPERQGGYGIKVSDRDLRGAIDMVAVENAFHPVRDYLEGTTWDGVHRVPKLFVDYVGATDNAYHREAAILWLIGAVTRIYEPGHKFDFVPILEGMQGKRKSTFFMTLARHWYAELEGDFHDKKAMVEQMAGAWIIEMPELQGFSKAEVTTIKGFISRQTDKVRLSYEKRAGEFPRQCVFGGTTNESEYLRDATGGRRFWPIECSVAEIDIDRLAENVDQIWAEALVLYREWRARYGAEAMLPLYIRNEAAVNAAKAMQESRRQLGSDDVLAARIEEWLSQPIGADLGLDDLGDEEPRYREITCLPEIWVEMMGRDINNYPDRDQQQLGRAMRRVAGWTTTGERERFPIYGRQRVYRRTG